MGLGVVRCGPIIKHEDRTPVLCQNFMEQKRRLMNARIIKAKGSFRYDVFVRQLSFSLLKTSNHKLEPLAPL